MNVNFKGILYYLSLFTFPISVLSFFNILFSSYFKFLLNIESYTFTLFLSLILGIFFYYLGRKSNKKIEFYEQLLLIILIYISTSFLISIPYYLSNYQITFVNSLFEAFSGVTGTGFTIFKNIKYIDPTLVLWRSASQWIGGLYFLVFLILFFSNSQFNYKLNKLVYSSDKSLNPEINIKKISLHIFFLYSFFTALIFILFSFSDIRLLNSLNLALTVISSGGFLPTNSLNQIIRTNIQEFILILSFILTTLNIFFFYNLYTSKNIFKKHYEDIALIILIIILSLIAIFFINKLNLLDVLLNILTSINTSGISINKSPNNFSLFFLFLTIIGGSIISNTSGIKFLRIYILLKASYIEILKLAKPNNIVKKNLLFSDNKIDSENIKLSFFIFISFFMSIAVLSSILLTDSINFENSFKLSILTLTNTVNSNLYGIENLNFANLLTSSKLFIIIFMIIAKIELISIVILIKKLFLKN